MRPCSSARRRRGFSLAETAVSILIVGGLLVVSLDLVGTTVKGRTNLGDRGRGRLLALDLMGEIVEKPYEDIEAPVFGVEAEDVTGERQKFDDVDDYHNWSASPPETWDGLRLEDLDGWERSVAVEYADPNDLTTLVGFDSGVKRITVTVRYNSKPVAEIVAIRTNGM